MGEFFQITPKENCRILPNNPERKSPNFSKKRVWFAPPLRATPVDFNVKNILNLLWISNVNFDENPLLENKLTLEEMPCVWLTNLFRIWP